MPKGQSPKLKGALCSVSIDVVDICSTLLQPADSNGIVIVSYNRWSYNTAAMFVLNK